MTVYNLNIKEGILDRLTSASPKIYRRFNRETQIIRRDGPDPDQKMNGYKDFYQKSIGTYVLVYQVREEEKEIDLLLFGPDKQVMDQLGHDLQHDKPGPEFVADPQTRHYVDPPPTTVEVHEAFTKTTNLESIDSRNKDDVPEEFNDDVLDNLDLSTEDIKRVLNCKSIQDLLDLGIDSEKKQALLRTLWPDPIGKVVQSPTREIPSGDALEMVADGKRNLESLLLKLDETQKPVTKRFFNENPSGPWIVKGGPGSGKSTVAIHCIKNLAETNRNFFNYKILLTTFTKALINASQHLLDHLGVGNTDVSIDVINADKLVGNYIPKKHRKNPVSKSNKIAIETAKSVLRRQNPNDFTEEDIEFLLEEMEIVTLANEIKDLTDYQRVERTGRGRRLGKNQRSQVWAFQKEFERILWEREGKVLYPRRFLLALDNTNPKYDYVFIDEAQDLTPAAVKFICALSHDPKNVFITADRNQSIYGSTFTWKRINEGLDFRGRSTLLRRNYRTTQEISDGIRPLLEIDDLKDEETLNDEPVRNGDLPELRFTSGDQEPQQIAEWFTKVAIEERITYRSCAVLCPSNRFGEGIAQSLPARFNAKFMGSEDLDLDHDGVKVMTMHSAKGLQFPAVAVVGLKEGLFPRKVNGGIDESEDELKQRRIFYVACSRAMNRLLVLADARRPSSLVTDLDVSNWCTS